jgi:hypothetical protein
VCVGVCVCVCVCVCDAWRAQILKSECHGIVLFSLLWCTVIVTVYWLYKFFSLHRLQRVSQYIVVASVQFGLV